MAQNENRYRHLLAIAPSPTTRRAHAIAIGMTFGPAAGLEAIPEADPQLVGYHRWHAARADLLRRLGDHARAAEEFALAADLASNAAERRWLSDRSRQLGDAASR